ncbi:hypothetical protein [Priestia aryabhattai]|jgi:hypothetical protein
MEKFLENQGLSEGIIETIKWWLPYLGFATAILAVIVITMIVRRRKSQSE